MDGEIIPMGLVREQAEKAAQRQDCPHITSPWPIGTAAGQMFVQEFHAARALQKARDQQGKGA